MLINCKALKTTGSFLVIILLSLSAMAQEVTPKKEYHKKGSFFFYWGYNRSFFSSSDLHFTGPNYDFTVHNVKASDRPSKFGLVYVDPAAFSVPQYNYRLGYNITDRLAISAGMDHMKYVMDQFQIAKVSGYISKEASEKYAGNYLDKPMKMDEDFLMFEHTNGFNYASLDVEYLQPLGSVWKDRLSFYWNMGLGGVWVITKTDVKVLGSGIDNRFHLSGYALSAKTGPRIEYLHRVFLAGELKGGYATLPDVLINGNSPERGEHNVSFLEYYIVAGVNFRIRM